MLLIASTHLAVGAAAGLAIQKMLPPDISNPEKLVWTFTAGFVSHLILDAVPHKEYSIQGSQLWSVLLIEIGIVFALVLSFQNSLLLSSLIFLGMAGGALPDLINMAYARMMNLSWLGNLGSEIHIFHGAIPLGFEVNFYWQSLITILAIIIVKLESA